MTDGIEPPSRSTRTWIAGIALLILNLVFVVLGCLLLYGVASEIGYEGERWRSAILYVPALGVFVVAVGLLPATIAIAKTGLPRGVRYSVLGLASLAVLLNAAACVISDFLV